MYACLSFKCTTIVRKESCKAINKENNISKMFHLLSNYCLTSYFALFAFLHVTAAIIDVQGSSDD